jgi:hypothetical protein
MSSLGKIYLMLLAVIFLGAAVSAVRDAFAPASRPDGLGVHVANPHVLVCFKENAGNPSEFALEDCLRAPAKSTDAAEAQAAIAELQACLDKKRSNRGEFIPCVVKRLGRSSDK